MDHQSYQDAQPYSELELAVDRSGNLEPVRYGPSSGLEVLRDKPQSDIEVVYEYGSKTHPGTDHNGNYTGIQQTEPRLQPRRKRRATWIFAAIVVVVLIIAAILGGIFGSKAHRNRAGSAPIVNNTSSNDTSPNNATASNVTKSIISDSALASVAWSDANGVIHYRVYYQDSNNMIKESAWTNADSPPKWYVSNEGIGTAKNGTPLAVVSTLNAKASAPSLHLIYLNSAGEINEWVTRDGITWVNGTINTHNITPDKNTQLAAASYFCNNNNEECNDSVLLIYQDSKNSLQLYNSTTDGFTTSSIPANAIPGSGLGLVVLVQDTYPAQLRLFYQIGSNDLVAADWIDASQAAASNLSNVNIGWNLHESTSLASFPPTAPVAAFVFGGNNVEVQSYTDEAGFPLLVNALASGSKGATSVPWYPDGNNTWAPAYQPPYLNAANNLSALAAHAWGSAYAMVGDELMEFSIQAYDHGPWTELGVVTTA